VDLWGSSITQKGTEEKSERKGGDAIKWPKLPKLNAKRQKKLEKNRISLKKKKGRKKNAKKRRRKEGNHTGKGKKEKSRKPETPKVGKISPI